MAETKTKKRLSKIATECNVGINTIRNFLEEKGYTVPGNPNAKIEPEVYEVLLKKFQGDKSARVEAGEIDLSGKKQIAKEEEKGKSEGSNQDVMVSTTLFESQEEEKTAEKSEKPEQKEKEEEKTGTGKQEKSKEKKAGPKVVGKIDIESSKTQKKTEEKPGKKTTDNKSEQEDKKKKEEKKANEKEDTVDTKKEKTEKVKEPEKETPPETGDEKQEKEGKIEEKPALEGPKVVGKIDLQQFKRKSKKRPIVSTTEPGSIKRRRKRKRIKSEKEEQQTQPKAPDKTKEKKSRKRRRKGRDKPEIDDKQIQQQIKETLTKLSRKQQGSSSRSKLRKKKREEVRQKETERQKQQEQEKKRLNVTEFITVNELANLLDVDVTEVITKCLELGLMVSINQRIDAETITLIADEFGYDVEFKEADMDEPTLEEDDDPNKMIPRAPIVTIMGHVDHGKTSLLDHIRKSNIIKGEAGGITQHIGAYEVTREDTGKRITFLDTPGHEAFTAMRARGAKATDVAIIVIAADDSIMPQTEEAISHAQAAGVPIVFAFNKIDKENANTDKVREQLADMDILVEEWGGKYQTQEISAKKGLNIDELLEKVLLEAEFLELKADPSKRATGTVIEATLDKGKGIVTNLLVQAGTLHLGDPVIAGPHYGKIRNMFNERGHQVKEAGPSQPIQILGFDGAPQAGDRFYVTADESVAKNLATERMHLIREQGIRATKHITLDEIGRRLAIGNFQELNLIIKGDVDGSVEALTDSLQKLSTEEIQVKVIHKGVGQITESDVLLASASDAVIAGFQVRPSLNAKRLAEKEQIDVRLYSVIYDAIEEIKAAMEGMLSPKIEEKVIGNVEVREVFKVSKVGKIAGCKVLDGKINRDSKVRLVRDGVVVYTGEIENLKRFKDDVKSVQAGYECGLNIKNYSDIKIGDLIEVYEEVEVKRNL